MTNSRIYHFLPFYLEFSGPGGFKGDFFYGWVDSEYLYVSQVKNLLSVSKNTICSELHRIFPPRQDQEWAGIK